MIRRPLLLSILALAASPCASAQVAVFSEPASESNVVRYEPGLATVADYPVTANLRGMAVNLVSPKPEPLLFRLPNGREIVLDVRRFDPIQGFEYDEKGEIHVPPQLRDEDLKYNVHAVAYGYELSFVVRDGRIAGSMNGKFDRVGQAWTIQRSNRRTVLRDMDLTKSPPELVESFPAESESSKSSIAPTQSKRAVDRGGTISVLVLHTANAILAADPSLPQGDQAAMNLFITQSLFDLQTALDNSQAHRVRINHLQPNGQISLPVAYDESPSIASVEQRWYAHRRWPMLDQSVGGVQDLLDLYDADITMLIVGDTGTCGVAFTQRDNCGALSQDIGCSVGSGFKSFAVAVATTHQDCSSADHHFPHEIGHTLGMEHSPAFAPAPQPPSFPWSHGHVISTLPVQARTVMTYRTACGNLGCPSFLNFSNHWVDFQSFPGTPTGVNTMDVQGRSRVNARTAIILAPAVSGFRGPAGPAAGTFGHGFEPLPDIICDPAVWPNCPGL